MAQLNNLDRRFEIFSHLYTRTHYNLEETWKS